MFNIFYEEPEDDRWFPFDRYPRRVIRRFVRGRPQPGGLMRAFLNLRTGLDRIGVRYRLNDYKHIKNNPCELACIIGKSFVLEKIEWKNPILLGPAINRHPIDDLQLFERLSVKKVLMPGAWARDSCKPYWGTAVEVCPTGIDTDLWRPGEHAGNFFDVLLYDKVRWEYEHYERSLIEPIRAFLREIGRSYREIRYGFYREEDFLTALGQCRTMIFLCEHETQGIAYQQALSCNVPVFAWDRGGPWKDPSFFPHRVIFEPVTSVPYWDERCGERFVDFGDFETKWDCFWMGAHDELFKPRDYILENLTLDKCARRYAEIASEVRCL